MKLETRLQEGVRYDKIWTRRLDMVRWQAELLKHSNFDVANCNLHFSWENWGAWERQMGSTQWVLALLAGGRHNAPALALPGCSMTFGSSLRTKEVPSDPPDGYSLRAGSMTSQGSENESNEASPWWSVFNCVHDVRGKFVTAQVQHHRRSGRWPWKNGLSLRLGFNPGSFAGLRLVEITRHPHHLPPLSQHH